MSRRVPIVLLALALVALVLAITLPARGAGNGPLQSAADAWRELVRDGRAGDTLPVELIVVFKAPALADAPAGSKDALALALDGQARALQKLAADGVEVPVRRRFTNAVNAVATAVPASQVEALRKNEVVRDVYPVRRMYPAAIVESALGSLGDAARPALADVPFDGGGVTVALLDGPVDAAHPYLQGRVAAPWNAITGLPSADKPTVDAARHATAMAGIVTGAGGPVGLRGVAPGARVLPIQVLEQQQGDLEGTTATFLAGMDRALDPNGDGDMSDRVRVILAPLTEPFAAFGDTAEALAVAGAERAGALSIAAAGNDGATSARFGTVGAPGASAPALGVGATDGRTLLPQVDATVVVSDLERSIAAIPLAGALAPIAGEPLVLASAAGPTRSRPGRDAEAPAAGDAVGDYVAPDGTRFAQGRAVLVQRDGGSLEAKAVAAAQAGARALLLYGDGAVANAALGLDDRVPIPLLVLPGAAGSELADAVAAGQQTTIEFSTASAPLNPTSGSVAGFSSRGLGFGGAVKPDLVAPGVAITSSLAGGGYAAITGTSAAAAQVAGAAALVVQAHPDWSVATTRGALIGYATSVGTAAVDGLEPVEAQGAGSIDGAAATAATLVAEPSTLSFGTAGLRRFSDERTIVLRNLGTEPVTATLALVRDEAEGGPTLGLTADIPNVTIPPGGSQAVQLTLDARGLDRAAGVRGGWILVERPGAPALRIPFALATAGDPTVSLIRSAQIDPETFSPSLGETGLASKLELALGAVGGDGATKLAIAPVSRLTIDLYRGKQRIGRLVEARSLLPGVYRYGLTGRSPRGAALEPGRYRLTIAAASLDGVTSERDVAFTVR